MTTRGITASIAAAMLAISCRIWAADLPAKPTAAEPLERREHIQVTTKGGELLYHVTEIHRMSEEVDETIVLVRDEGFMDLIFRSTSRWSEQVSVQRVSDLSGRAFVQHSWRANYKARTRTKALAEMRENQALLTAPVIVTVETNGGKWEEVEADREDLIGMRRLRHQQRVSMSPALLEAIERMRGTFFTTRPGQSFVSILARDLLYEGDREMFAEPESVVVAKAAPHCDFDKAFGYPCTKAQLKRIAQAEKDGKTLTSY